MSSYFTVGEISAEIGVSDKTLYKRAKLLGIDTSKIDSKQKKALIEACSDTISRKQGTKFLMDIQSNVKVENVEAISGQTGSTIESRLQDAKREYDALNLDLIEVAEVIRHTGRIVTNGNNGATSISSAMKTKLELLKQFISLQTKIQDLEDKLKYSVQITKQESAIDD